MARTVCVLTESQAHRFETGGETPDCSFHEHVSFKQALVEVDKNDGQGRARLLKTSDSRMRIVRIPHILRWRGVPAFFGLDGSMGPSVMQPLYARRSKHA